MRKAMLVLAVVGLVCLTGPARAADTDTISVTVSLAVVISVDVTPATWNIGATALSYISAPHACSATNDGNVTEDLTITGADGANGWTIASNPGTDEFAVKLADGTPLTTSAIPLVSSLAVGSSHPFEIAYFGPTDDTQGGGVDHSFTITITAAQSP